MADSIVEKIRKTLKESHSVNIYGDMIHLEIFQKDKTVTMNINTRDEWKEIESSINVHLQQILTRQCPLCFVKDNKKLFRNSCRKCAFYWCNSCNLKMIHKSQRFDLEKKCFYYLNTVCPSCDFSVDKNTCFMEMQ